MEDGTLTRRAAVAAITARPAPPACQSTCYGAGALRVLENICSPETDKTRPSSVVPTAVAAPSVLEVPAMMLPLKLT